MQKQLTLISNAIIFVLGVWLVVKNRATVGMMNLFQMVIGVALLFFLIYRYNKQFK